MIVFFVEGRVNSLSTKSADNILQYNTIVSEVKVSSSLLRRLRLDWLSWRGKTLCLLVDLVLGVEAAYEFP